MNILILFNAIKESARHDQQDVLVQVKYISDFLQQQGQTVTELACDLDLSTLYNKLKLIKTDLVINLVEDLDGHDQFANFIPALLENLRIPFTGASSDALYLTNNKILAKQLLRHNNLPTPAWYELNSHYSSFIKGEKYIIKSVCEHASFAIDEFSVVTPKNEAALIDAIIDRERSYKCKFFAEKYINGREFNAALVDNTPEPELLPIAEMQFLNYENSNKILTYNAKWHESSHEYQTTIRSFDFKHEDDDLIITIKQLCSDAWRAIRLCGYARIDFRVDERNNPFILEINANPCLSPNAGFIAASQQKYKSPTAIISKILNSALRRQCVNEAGI